MTDGAFLFLVTSYGSKLLLGYICSANNVSASITGGIPPLF